MNGYLLDTNVVLVGLSEPERLKARVRSAVLAGRNILSVLVYWEVMLKSMKGKLDIGDPRVWWETTLVELAAKILPILPDHVSSVGQLPPLHQDPFDRMLIAQAIAEDLTVVTTDGAIPEYASKHLKVIA